MNKRYVDNKFEDIFGISTNYFEYELYRNVTVPTNLPQFTIPYTSKAFLGTIYINTINTSSAYTLRGLKESTWKMTSSFIGGNVNDIVKFYINDDGVNLNIQYTNTATSGLTFVSYRLSSLIETDDSEIQSNISLNGNVNIPSDITGLSFNNPTINGIKLLIYISSDIDSKYSLVDLNALHKNGTWVLNTFFTGNVDTIVFNITSSGQIQYTNSSATSDYIIRVKEFILDDLPTEYTLIANTTTSNLERLDILMGEYINTYFLALVYVYLPTQNRYALYELEGITISNIFHINSRFIGDNIGIEFSLTTTSTGYYLSYTNPNNVNGYLRLVNAANPLKLSPLPVSKGGTGTNYLNEYTILRGDGLDKIVGTSDLIYKDNQLSLGDVSSIVLKSTENALNLTTGTLVSYGGISVKKDVNVGGNLNVNNVNIKPSIGDIYEEQSFNGYNSQTIQSDVTGFVFNNAIVRYFHAFMSVSIVTNNVVLNAGYELKGIQTSGPSWMLHTSFIGDDTFIKFYITSSGQIQYTSSNISDWISTTMKFRALTTSI